MRTHAVKGAGQLWWPVQVGSLARCPVLSRTRERLPPQPTARSVPWGLPQLSRSLPNSRLPQLLGSGSPFQLGDGMRPSGVLV